MKSLKKIGEALRSRDDDQDQPSQTEQLANWISKVRMKKMAYRRNRKRDLRMEAVLTHALSKAELELRNKQMSRFRRWQQLKKRLTKDGGDYDIYCECKTHYSNSYEEEDPWQQPLCPELSSLDSFMAQLGEIKVPLER